MNKSLLHVATDILDYWESSQFCECSAEAGCTCLEGDLRETLATESRGPVSLIEATLAAIHAHNEKQHPTGMVLDDECPYDFAGTVALLEAALDALVRVEPPQAEATESEPTPGLPMPAPESDTEIVYAVRCALWEHLRGRTLGGDRTLVGMINQLATERDEAQANRRGEYELRTEAEAAARRHAEAASDALDLLDKIAGWPADDWQGLKYHAFDAARRLRAEGRVEPPQAVEKKEHGA